MRKLIFISAVVILAAKVNAAPKAPSQPQAPPKVEVHPESVPEANDARGRLGVGAQVGTIGAVSAKYFLVKHVAIDAGVEFLDHPWGVFFTDLSYYVPGVFGKGTRFGRQSALY